jgi:phage shock protein C
MNKKLYRDEHHKMVGGVCAGLADYFNMDVTVVRLLVAFGVFIGGFSIIPYFILWIVLPKKGYAYPGFNGPTVDYTVPPQQPNNPFNTPPYQANTAYDFSQPTYFPPKRRSNAGMIVGVILIFIGAIILADQFNFIPDFDFDKLWPITLVIVGAAIIVSGQKMNPWDKPDWHKTTETGPIAEDGAHTAYDTKTV